MTSVPNKSPAVACAENIALLHALHSVPKPPSKSEAHPASKWPGGYRLSFDQERWLASAFAFLSSIADDPNHVSAVCIQEDRNRESLKVLLAVNKRNHDDGRAVLKTIKRGLESVVEPLARLGRALKEGEAEAPVEDDIFTAIVSMCQKRILCRLRLIANNKGKPKPPLKTVLQQAFDSLRQRRTNNIAQIVAHGRVVIKLLDAWTRHQVLARLQELVEGVHRLHETTGLYDAFRTIPNVDMHSEARDSLVNIIQKVSRYRQIARLLYRMAMDTPMLRQTSIVLVDLPPSAFREILPGKDYAPDISAKIVEVCGAKGYSKQQINTLFQFLKTDRDTAAWSFDGQTRKTLADAKIHAEIQLVVYCAQHAPFSNKKELPPRVVRSNKDACFLCNAFIQKYGNMYTSRHHGKLYPGWRLPQSLSANVQKSFNVVLAETIRASMATLKKRKVKSKYPDPNESTLTTLPSLRSGSSSSSTVVQNKDKEDTRSDVTGENDITKKPALPKDVVQDTPASNDSQPKCQALPPQSQYVEEKDMKSTDEKEMVQTMGTVLSEKTTHADTPQRRQSLQSDNTTRRTTGKASTELLSMKHRTGMVPETSAGNGSVSLQGHANIDSIPPTATHVPVLSGRIRQGRASMLYDIAPFRVQIDYAKEVHGLKAEGKEMCFSIQQLTAEDVDRLQKDKIAIVYIEELCLGDEVLCVLDDLDCLYIAARNSVLKISLCFPL